MRWTRGRKPHKRPGREALKHRREGALARLESQRRPLVAEVAVREKEMKKRLGQNRGPICDGDLDLGRIDREIATLKKNLAG